MIRVKWHRDHLKSVRAEPVEALSFFVPHAMRHEEEQPFDKLRANGLGLALLLAVPLASCTIPVKLPDSKTCRAEGPMGYVGQRYTDRIGRIIKDKAQATYVRTIGPGMMVTQEFRANRVNVTLDEKNTITRIYCG